MSAQKERESWLWGPRMSSCRSVSIARIWLIFAACCFLPASLYGADRGDKSWHSTPDLSMGTQDVQLEGHCLRMSASIVDSSLAKLHRKKGPSGPEFHHGKTVVSHFPDEVTVVVTVTNCVSPFGTALSEEALNTIQFAAAWRCGNDERPVGGIYIPHARPKDPWSESNDTFRDYELSIQSDGVPLTDHLVVSVSAGGKILAQFVNAL
jgi:hypothetical protein